MWLAREKNGLLRIYTEKPIRKEESGVWYLPDDGDCMTIDSAMFPYVKWEDGPIEVDIISHELNQDYEKIVDMYEEEHCNDYTLLSSMCDNNGNTIDMEEFIKKNDK